MQNQSLFVRAPAGYQALARVLNGGQHVVLLAVRLYFGFICMRSGYRHLTNFHKMVEQFIEWRVPMPTISVAVSSATELVGGAMLMAGLLSRLISVPLLFNFLVALVVPNLADPDFHDKILHFWNYPDVVLKDDAFPLFCTAILIVFFGPGLLSIDAIARRFLFRSRGSTAAARPVTSL